MPAIDACQKNVNTTMMARMIFYQLFEHESSTYTYLLADDGTREAVLIDPVLETVERDIKLIEELGLRLVTLVETHVHADHVTGAAKIRDHFPSAQTTISFRAGVASADRALREGDTIAFGRYLLRALETPGHTDSCMSFYLAPLAAGESGRVFTGDALMIRGTGRTDFQQGSSDVLYDSVTRKLFTLPDDTCVFPAHDYRGQTMSTIGLEKAFNPRLGGGKTKEQFRRIMSDLKLAPPKKLAESLPANLAGGRISSLTGATTAGATMFKVHTENGIPEITAEDLASAMKRSDWTKAHVHLIDVRRPEEYVGEYGHVEGAELVTLGPDLQARIDAGKREETIVFICRSGARSGQATQYAIQQGYKDVYNMQGGMLRWTELKLPAVK